MIPKYNIKRIKSKLDSRPLPFLPPVIIQQMELDIYDPVVLAAFEDMANVYGWVLGDDIEDLYEIDFYFDVTRAVEYFPDRQRPHIRTSLRVYSLPLPFLPDDPFFPLYDSSANLVEFKDAPSLLYTDLYEDQPTNSYFVRDNLVYKIVDDTNPNTRPGAALDYFASGTYDDLMGAALYKIYYQDASGQWYQALLSGWVSASSLSERRLFKTPDGQIVVYIDGWISSSPPKNPLLLKDKLPSGPYPAFYSRVRPLQFIKSNTGKIYQVELDTKTEYANVEVIKNATLVSGFSEGPIRQAFDSWSSSVLREEVFRLPNIPGEFRAHLINLTPNFITTAGGYEGAGEFGMMKLVALKSKLFTGRLERVISHFGGEDEAREYLSDNFEVLRALFREGVFDATSDDEMYNLLKPATKRVLEKLAQAEFQDTQLSFDF